MSLDSPQSTVYEMRRQQRGEERPPTGSSWKRKLILGTVLVLGIGAAAAVAYVRWHMTHVRTVRAQVWAKVVQLSPDVDARMKELLVQPGDHVRKGQVLARLDDSEQQARLASAEADEALKQSLYAQAQADLRVTEATVNANIERARLGVAAAEARLSRAQAQEREARGQLDKLTAPPRPEDVEAAQARLATARAMQELYALEVQQSEQLVGEGIDSAHMLQVKKTQLATQKNTVREAELALERMLAGPTAEERRIAEHVLAARQADVALANAELQQAKAELARAESMKAQIALARERVNAAAAELRIAQANTEAVRAVLDRMAILCPVDGTVIRTFDEVGEVCRRGVTTIMVSDDSKGRWIEGYVTERDAARVQVGQKAKVEVMVGSGLEAPAEVAAVSLATNSLDRGGSEAGAQRAYGASELVWVKLRLLEQSHDWLPCNSAQAVITTR